jgi:hypothetical protein
VSKQLQPQAKAASTPAPSFTSVQADLIQRKCACGGAAGLTGDCQECGNKQLAVQRRADTHAEPSSVPPIVHEVLRSPGHPLANEARAFFEPRFGHDFSKVRVHADAKAAESARAVNALAYTVGHDVVFDQGQYRPETVAGRSTLAHELTHVVQQSGAAQTQSAPLEIGQAGDAYEQEADATAHRVALGTPVSVHRMMTSSAVRCLQRQTQQDTHAGLFELARHGQLGGPTFVPEARYDVRIEFLPYDIVDCTQIALTQDSVAKVAGKVAYSSAADKARALTSAEGTKGVSIDRLSGSTSPYYGTTNAGVTNSKAHFGSHTPGNPADRAWLEDKPGFPGTATSSRTAGDSQSFRFETCAVCDKGTDEGAYYGCVSWGYDIDASNTFTEAPFARVSRGTPSADFLAAAKKWNKQTVPVATDDLPLPTHRTNNKDLTRAKLDAEITSLEKKLKALAPGHANMAQITFELRVLRDIRDAIVFNEGVLSSPYEVRQVQAIVGATETGKWTYETIQKLKIWQAKEILPITGQLDPESFNRMNIRPVGDFPEPIEELKSTG